MCKKEEIKKKGMKTFPAICIVIKLQRKEKK
jgi:hypothetical protein